MSLFTLFLALLGVGFLIFIHELGHYFMGRRVGMTVEVFSIGFGQPIISWERKGVRWQVGWLPFGGYVRFKGMERRGNVEPYEIPDGFFGKSPWKRILVVLMGPLTNIAFALVAFTALWGLGGREVPFSQVTRVVGAVDSCSALYQDGLRPGDRLTRVDGRELASLQELRFMEKEGKLNLRVDLVGQAGAMNVAVPPQDLSTMGPASFLLYGRRGQKVDPLTPGSPLYASGIQSGDELVWADGVPLYSASELVRVINEPRVFATVERQGEVFLARLPRVRVSDLQMNATVRGELDDWRHEAGLKERLADLYFVPYTLSSKGVVESEIVFLNERALPCTPTPLARDALSHPLQVGDRIVAIQGYPVHSAVDLMKEIQQRSVRLIVRREAKPQLINFQSADQTLLGRVDGKELEELAKSLGTGEERGRVGDLVLLQPVTPKPISLLPLTKEQRESVTAQEKAVREEIEEISDATERTARMKLLERDKERLALGVPLQDALVNYNPSPLRLFAEVVEGTYYSIAALFKGSMSMSGLGGPVRVVEVLQGSWSVGLSEVFFWMGVISLNLGLLNLLPIPMLDGGHLVFSLHEWVTGKPIPSKIRERLIIPFMVLLIALFLYVTYNDLLRLFSRFF